MRISTKKKSARTAGLVWAMLFALLAVVGCDRQPRETDNVDQPEAGATATSTAPAEEDTSAKPADAQDDKAAPRALPRSSEVQGWIKTGAAKVAAADQAAEFIGDPALAGVVSSFKVQQLAKAEYTSPNAKATVLMVQGRTPDDALGIFSMVNGGAECTPREDGSLRVMRGDDQQKVLTAWQDHEFIRVECTVEKPEGVKGCGRLIGRTVFGLASAEPPLLMRAVKELKQEHCRFWAVRSAGGLAKQSIPRLQQIEPTVLDERLGLKGDVLLSAVAVEQAQGAAPVIIWLAQYPDAEEAKAAGDRYTKALEAEPKGLDSVTFVGAAKGVYLMGTWTADQQAAKEMVKMLAEVLPEK